MRATAIAAILLAFAGPTAAEETRPSCAGPVEIARAEVVRVEPTNDELVLKDGRAVHLEGIRLPHAGQDHAPAWIADQAYDALDALATGRRLKVTAVPPKEDRYDRVRGQVFGEDGWLQIALLRKGLARVDIAPDRTECAAQFYAAETAARDAGAGLWALPAYRVRGPNGLSSDIGAFELVEGKVLAVDVKGGRAYLDFGTDWRKDFTATIAPEDMKTFRRAGADPRDYAGKTVRLRGVVQLYHGPEIEIANPQQVELAR
jgi:endonuclease YncB( thermonuclease family)